jgi:hypothetical protein
MKRFSLLALLSLVAFVFAIACTDATSPSSRTLLAPKSPDLGFRGEAPPPPADVAMEISINSPGSAIFTGVFFSNGKISDDGLLAEPTFDGTAWLRLDNKQPTPNGTAGANTRFMVKDADPPTGMGTLSFLEGGNVVTYKIVRVDEFTRFLTCGAPLPGLPPGPCAIIRFKAEVVGGPSCNLDTNVGCHDGNLEAFDKASCLVLVEGSFEFVCGGSID